MAILIACGNSICGNSAIAAVAPVIGADGDDIASSIAFTAVLGVLVVLGLPFVVPIWASSSYGDLITQLSLRPRTQNKPERQNQDDPGTSPTILPFFGHFWPIAGTRNAAAHITALRWWHPVNLG